MPELVAGQVLVQHRRVEVRPTPSWVNESTSTPLQTEDGHPTWDCRYGLETSLYWAGPADKWGGESRHELCFNDLNRVCYETSYGHCQSTRMTLADLATVLKTPDCSNAALRWV